MVASALTERRCKSSPKLYLIRYQLRASGTLTSSHFEFNTFIDTAEHAGTNKTYLSRGHSARMLALAVALGDSMAVDVDTRKPLACLVRAASHKA